MNNENNDIPQLIQLVKLLVELSRDEEGNAPNHYKLGNIEIDIDN